MELQFKKQPVTVLDTGLREVRSQEQTQEIRLSEGMPDISRVLGAWGQAVMRSKEWRSSEVGASAGMMVWVLYQPEDGTQPRCVECWIPFQLRWDLPAGTPEGSIRIRCLPRFVDARSTSARKIMVRAGMGAEVQALVRETAEIFAPMDDAGEVELLRSRYPVRMVREAGEKAFRMDEELPMPESLPQPETIVSCVLRPELTEQKVLANRLVFRGNANAHLLYLSEEGQLHSWDFPMPFSQYADLETGYSGDAQTDCALCVTNLEPELDTEGRLRIKCGMVCQYLVDDVTLAEVAEDAYCPGRELEMERELLELPAILENRRELLRSEITLPGDVNLAADVRFLPDFPRQRRTGEGLELELTGTCQLLCYGAEGGLQSASGRWEGRMAVPADESCTLAAVPGEPGEPQTALGSGTVTVRTEVPVQLTTTARTKIPMITALKPGAPRKPDPSRPSLILRRAGEERLWDIARSCGSTVDAIRKANGLEGDPDREQLLLIPVS